MLIIYAALLAVPKELEEAARLDGASWWQTFWRIRFPYIRPVWITTTIMATTFALRGFDIPYLLTNGGPGPVIRAAHDVHVQDSLRPHRLRLCECDLGLHRRRVPRRRRPDLPAPASKGRVMSTILTPPDGVVRLRARSGSDAQPHRSPRLRVQRTILTVTVVLIVVVQVYPLAWLFLTSFRTAGGLRRRQIPFAIPSEFTLDNYARAFETGNLWLNIAQQPDRHPGCERTHRR